MAVSDYSTTPADNTSISGLTVTDATLADALDNIIRQMMADIKVKADSTDTAIGLKAPIANPTFTGAITGGSAAFTGALSGTTAAFSGAVTGTDFQHIGTIDITSSTAAAVFGIPSDYTKIALEIEEFEPVINGSFLQLRVGTGGSGGSFLSTSNYVSQLDRTTLSGTSNPTQILTGWPVSTLVNSSDAAFRGHGVVRLKGFNTASGRVKGLGELAGVDTTPQDVRDDRTYRFNPGITGTYNAIQLLANTGNIANLKVDIFGIRNG